MDIKINKASEAFVKKQFAFYRDMNAVLLNFNKIREVYGFHYIKEWLSMQDPLLKEIYPIEEYPELWI